MVYDFEIIVISKLNLRPQLAEAVSSREANLRSVSFHGTKLNNNRIHAATDHSCFFLFSKKDVF